VNFLAKDEANALPSTQVIIAALNEEQGIGPTVAEIIDTLKCPYILVVDGRSVDRTVKVARNLGVDVISQTDLGKGDAMSKAIGHIDPDVDYVVFTDADYTYPALYIPGMIGILEKSPEVGMVCGNRFSGYEDMRALNSIFYLGNRFIAFTHNILNGIALDDPLTGLRVVRAGLLRGWTVKSKGFDFEVELNHRVERKGFSIMELPIKYRERLGEKKLGVKHGAEILKRILLETTY
jgi:glycosyltransferase involved in cell wall biosynthesis